MLLLQLVCVFSCDLCIYIDLLDSFNSFFHHAMHVLNIMCVFAVFERKTYT